MQKHTNLDRKFKMRYEDKFELDFMKRTLEIVEEYQGELDATLLLNCLLGLLIVPKETSLLKIPKDPIRDLEKWGISPDSIKEFGKETKGNDNPRTLRGIVWHLRNSVAHFRFVPIYDNNQVIGFEFNDQSGFLAELNLSEMNTFVRRLARHIEGQYSV